MLKETSKLAARAGKEALSKGYIPSNEELLQGTYEFKMWYKNKMLIGTAVAVMAIGISFGLALFFVTQDLFLKLALERFSQEATLLSVVVSSTIGKATMWTPSFAAFLCVSNFRNNLNLWDTFDAQASAFDESLGHVQAIEYIPRVSMANRSDFEHSANTRFNSTTLRIYDKLAGNAAPAGDRDVYYPVFNVYPHEPNKGAFLFDLGSSGARLAAMEKARDTAQSAASSKITLVQSDSTGFLNFYPLYDDCRNVPVQPADRKTQLVGFALFVFDTLNLLRQAFESKRPQNFESLSIVDITNPGEVGMMGQASIDSSTGEVKITTGEMSSRLSSLVKSDPDLTAFEYKQTFDVSDRKWMVVVLGTDTSSQGGISFLFLVFCIAMAGLSVGYVVNNHQKNSTLVAANILSRQIGMISSENMIKSLRASVNILVRYLQLISSSSDWDQSPINSSFKRMYKAAGDNKSSTLDIEQVLQNPVLLYMAKRISTPEQHKSLCFLQDLDTLTSTSSDYHLFPIHSFVQHYIISLPSCASDQQAKRIKEALEKNRVVPDHFFVAKKEMLNELSRTLLPELQKLETTALVNTYKELKPFVKPLELSRSWDSKPPKTNSSVAKDDAAVLPGQTDLLIA